MKQILAALALLTATTAVWGQTAAPPTKSPSVEDQRRFFTEDGTAPMVKPAGYDVTIVEYMDYQCPFCRASHKPMKQLLAKDKKVRVIYRDWPTLGGASVYASLIAIASKYQGKHAAVHDALMMASMPLTNAKIETAAKKAGVDWVRLEKDLTGKSEEIEDLLARNDKQAQLLGLEGTPGFIIGDVQSFGGMDLKAFEGSIKKARAGKGTKAALITEQPAGI